MRHIYKKISFNSTNFIFGILLFILVLTPQINNTDFVFSTITSKSICFFYGCIILIGFYTIQLIGKKTFSFSITKLDIALLFLVAYITFNRYFIQIIFGFSIRYLELIGLVIFYISLRKLSLQKQVWLLLVITISGIIQALYGNLQLLGYYNSNHAAFKMTGSFFNPGPYAGFLISVWPIALGMYLYKEKIIEQLQLQINNQRPHYNQCLKYIFDYIPLLGLVSIAIVIPATQSRAAWLATIISSLVLLELKYAILRGLLKKSNSYKKTALYILAIVILSTGLFGIYQFKKKSSDGRMFIWKQTTQMIADHPVFGVGFDRFTAHYMNYQANYFAKKGETAEAILADNTNYAFNEGLQFVAENGLLGLFFLTIILFIILKTKVKEEHKYWFFITTTGLLSIGIFASFSYPMQILPIKLVLVFLIAMQTNCDSNCYSFKTSQNIKMQWVYRVFLLLGTIVCISKSISYTQNLSHGFTSWNKALNSHQFGDYEEAILEFETAYPLLKEEGSFLMNYGKTLTMAGEYKKAITILKQAKNYQNNTIIATALGDSYKATNQYHKAKAAYQQAANMIPSQFYPNYLLAKLYDDYGQNQEAKNMAKKILYKKIKIPSTAIEEIRLEMKNILNKHKNLRVKKLNKSDNV